ncbi:MAG TPA: FAD-binding and (Fe-S)-binding domain-containing protein [Thermoleophilaceae bacterium]|nr:FAD-binding and (Fe-S)-binding domain-containing protein [Thermoleophilaceae bacterium]
MSAAALPLAPPASEPAADRAPDSLAAGTPEPLRSDLVALLGKERVLARAIDLVRYASDASPYRRFPKAVVMAHDARDVARVIAYGRREGVPVTLRAGGTSLNGQAQGDGILVDVRRHFTGVEVLEAGRAARVRPGTVLGHANRVLARHGTRLGPDPASTDIATVGGVIANNAGGMRCGVVEDSYSTLRSLTLVLPDGSVIDTAAPDAGERLDPGIALGLAEIRDEIRADPELSERIRSKFRIKNTTGYRLCAFLDADEPVEILRRLVVGSEGTLAFIAEAVFETVPVPRQKTTALLLFPSIDAAAAAVPPLVACGSSATELMVATTLLVAAHNFEGAPERWKELPPDAAAVLCELGADDVVELDRLERKALAAIEGHEFLDPPSFTRDREETELFWRVREGMFGLVGEMRPLGTSLIPEDVCVPPERVAEAAKDLQALLGEHGFLPGVAGHASAGNLHFMLTPAFGEEADRDRYDRFMTALCELIVDRYDGSLKAEHGTGLNMAPFVEREWGERATALMWRVKELIDPDGVLGPGVLLNRDPRVHLRDLKSSPAIEEVANKCVECGFCEPVCPSRDLTTTPRQRIVVRREMARQPAGSPVLRALVEQYAYDGVHTCAVDGSCRLACPVKIDTGALVKDLRARMHTPRAERAGRLAAERFALAERAARAGLRTGNALSRSGGGGLVRGATRALRRALGEEVVPEWIEPMPRAAPARLPATGRTGAAAVYLPACVNRILGPPEGRRPLPDVLVGLSARAGMPIWIPSEAAGHCCSVPWSSKGLASGHEAMAERVAASAREWTGGGQLPLVTDASSCANGLREEIAAPTDGDIEILDGVEWAERLLPALGVEREVGVLALHPTCSGRHSGADRSLRRLASALAREVVVPPSAGCCGFAGDRGFLRPELTAAATRHEAAELDGRAIDAWASANRPCEIGLERATGRRYESIVYLLDDATR